MRHALKTWPAYFRAVESGDKPFEIRKNDRNYKVGDTLLLQEFNPMSEIGKQYTGNELEFVVTYILLGDEIGKNFGVQDGFIVMGIKQKEY